MSLLWCRERARGVAPAVAPAPLEADKVKPEELPFGDSEEPEVEPKVYTRTEINRLNVEELKALADAEGLDNSLSGAKLKKLLIEHFGI